VTGRRYRVAGLAHARSGWFGEVGRWSTTALVPVEFLKCIHPEELLALVDGGTPLSAALVDLGAPGVDRDLLEDVRRSGTAVLVVRGPGVGPPAVPVDRVLTPDFGPDELTAALEEHAVPCTGGDRPMPPTDGPARPHRGRMVVCCGPGGTGASVVAMATAQGLAADPRRRGLVALADLARHADQALLHDAGDVAPGLPELVDAHRLGDPDTDAVRGVLHAVPARGYDLLLGLRRHRDWTVLRPRAVGAALDGLLAAYAFVVADADADLEGEPETGSIDVEERNTPARAACARADLVAVVGAGDTKGVHALARTVRQLLDHGVPADRVQPVVNRAARRRPAGRAAVTAALGELVGAPVASPLFVPEQRRLEAALRGGDPLPPAVAGAVADAVHGRLERLPARAEPEAGPVPVLAGRRATHPSERPR
jgi:hypothetical protein